MILYHVRYTMPNDRYIYVFACNADSYEEAEELLESKHPGAILVNIEEPDAPDYKANH